MKQLHIYIYIISISVCAQNVFLEVDTNTLRIGEHFNAKVSVYDLDSDSVNWSMVDSVFSGFELLNNPTLTKSASGDSYKKYLLTNFDTGTFRLPSLPVAFNNFDTVYINSITLQYLSTPVDTTNSFFDIKPPQKITFSPKELLYFLPYFLIVLILIIIVFLIFNYFRKNKPKVKDVAVVEKPIDVFYLEKLDYLIQKKYLERNQYKIFYTELSEIFRGYLENRFDILALESGTSELKLLLTDIGVKEKWLNKFLRSSDIVKFAKGVPSINESELFIDDVKFFIQKYGVKENEKEVNKQKVVE